MWRYYKYLPFSHIKYFAVMHESDAFFLFDDGPYKYRSIWNDGVFCFF